MRLLHLGDLHLGKSLGEFDLIEDQRYILDQIMELIRRYNLIISRLSDSSSEHRFNSNQHLTQVKRLRDIIISSHSYNIYLCLNHILR